jgi:aryl-alcohol dehydrogenase-like predicted oxidoreductase
LIYQPLGVDGVRVSQAGFGCYRVDVSVEEHRQALKQALEQGINLIDTSANYTDGGSEELVGVVLQEMIKEGQITREEVVIVSKVGYLQGQNYRVSQERKKEGRAFLDLVLYGQGLEHCIHPEFLEDQLTRSLARLQMETLDCYLLHNPEYYLGWAKNAGLSLESAREEYYRRIELAFRYLEEEVAKGRIRSYGISSNTFPASASDYQFTSLTRVWEIAESISSDHHFQVIQMPMNLYETGGATESNQRDGQTVLEFSRVKGLGVLINRPLNAFHRNQLIRLADVTLPAVAREEIGTIPALLQGLIEIETQLKTSLLPVCGLDEAERAQAEDKLSAGVLLQQHWRSFSSEEHWHDVQTQFLVPTVQGGIQLLLKQLDQSRSIGEWIETYVDQVNRVMQSISHFYQLKREENISAIKAQVSRADREWGEADTLSQMAIRALRSSEGITTVLVGMRRAAYVEDVVKELAQDVEVCDRKFSWLRMVDERS